MCNSRPAHPSAVANPGTGIHILLLKVPIYWIELNEQRFGLQPPYLPMNTIRNISIKWSRAIAGQITSFHGMRP